MEAQAQITITSKLPITAPARIKVDLAWARFCLMRSPPDSKLVKLELSFNSLAKPLAMALTFNVTVTASDKTGVDSQPT